MYLTQTLFEPDIGVMLDVACRALKEGNQLSIVYCNGDGDFCFCNPSGSKMICAFCKYYRHYLINKYLPGTIRTIPISFTHEKNYGFSFSNFSDIKNIFYKDCAIGYAVLSTYISVTRNPEPAITKSSYKYFSALLNQTANLTDMAYQVIEDMQPDQILIFNGRHFENRPFLNVGQKKKIPVSCYENIGSFRSGENFSYMEYENDIPQSLKIASKMIAEMWDDKSCSIEEKKQKAIAFYERRRNGIPAGDRVYTQHQIRSMLPKNWDSAKRNIVIFNSSEDEFASLDKDFTENNLFESQIKAWEFLFSNIQTPDYHFYLRVHPNLAQIPYAYHISLYELEQKYHNVTIISPLDQVSSYALMEAAEKIIVAGSTMGAEAAYSGKPVILIASAFYSSLNFCYKPREKEEFIHMVRLKLPTKNNLDTLKYAYFILYRNSISIKPEYCDISIRRLNFFGKSVFTSNYCKILGSCFLWKISRLAVQYIFRHFGRFKLPDPYFKNHITS